MTREVKDYKSFENIGSGSYGEIFRAKNKQNQREFAVKLIPLNKLPQISMQGYCTINEIKTLTTIGSSQFMAKYYQSFQADKHYCLVYLYCSGGTLHKAIKKIGSFFREKNFENIQTTFRSIESSQQIQYCDIKPQNIFFNQGKVKLGDFGFRKEYKKSEDKKNPILGTPLFMAPEAQNEQQTPKSDIRSLGVVLYYYFLSSNYNLQVKISDTQFFVNLLVMK